MHLITIIYLGKSSWLHTICYPLLKGTLALPWTPSHGHNIGRIYNVQIYTRDKSSIRA